MFTTSRFKIGLAVAVSMVMLSACDKQDVKQQKSPTGNSKQIVIGSGSENATFFPSIEAWAKSKGKTIQFVAKGSVDLTNDVSAGKAAPYDYVWPASSSLIESADKQKVVKGVTSIMLSPVIPIVKRSKAESLGWLKNPVTNADFYKAVKEKKLNFGMTSASQSYSGQAAYMGMLSVLSGNQDVLTKEDLDNPKLPEQVKAILSQIARSSGSSGALKDFIVANYANYDAMLNYEGLAWEANQVLASQGKEPMCAIMPADGVVIADHSIGYIDRGDADKNAFFNELVTYLKSSEFQATLKSKGRRVGMSLLTSEKVVSYDSCWDTNRPIKLITMPTPEVVAQAIDLYQSAFRKPSLTVYVGDFSRSMSGEGEKQLKIAMHTVLDQNEARKWSLQATSRDVNIFIPFSSTPWGSIKASGNDSAKLNQLYAKIYELEPNGGTEIYLGLLEAIRHIEGLGDISGYSTSIILMTDGASDKSKLGEALSGLTTMFQQKRVGVYAIMFGDANPAQLIDLTKHQTGGNDDLAKQLYVCDGRKDLVGCFRKVRGNNS